jgi:hypothetical protein
MWKSFAPFIACFSLIAATAFLLPMPAFTNLDPHARLSIFEPSAPAVPIESINLPEEPPAEETLATIDEEFRCTIYYTPRESGFTAEAGFDTTPETRPGLSGKTFPRDFLLAVQKEGYGRLKDAVAGNEYLRYCGGDWSFAVEPVDSLSRPLVPKQTCAVKPGHKWIRREARFRLCGTQVPAELEDLRWIVSDTGSGLRAGQIDLYWGEDDPYGPGKRISRPKTSPATIEQATVIVLR